MVELSYINKIKGQILCYRKIKKNNKVREIFFPNKNISYGKMLDNILDELKTTLSDKIEKPEYSHFAKKENHKCKSHLDICEQHMNKTLTITMDIKDFFPSITKKMVKKVLKKYKVKNAYILANLVTVKNKLPQGFRTSSILAFACAKPAFDKIYKECKKRGLLFTNYVDDIQISSKNYNENMEKKEVIEMVTEKVIEMVTENLKKFNLIIKDSKTKIFVNGKDKEGNTKKIMNIEYNTNNRKELMSTDSKDENYKKQVEKHNKHYYSKLATTVSPQTKR